MLTRGDTQFEIFPNGSTPIAAFLNAPTESIPEVNATSATFAEILDEAGNKRMILNPIQCFNSRIINGRKN